MPRNQGFERRFAVKPVAVAPAQQSNRRLVRAYRLALLEHVLQEAGEPLRFYDVVVRLRKADGIGIPRRTLFEPPFADLISAQTPRRGRIGELAGLPWRLRKLSHERRVEWIDRLSARLHARNPSAKDAGTALDHGQGMSDRQQIERIMELEEAIASFDLRDSAQLAKRMCDRLVARREAMLPLRAGAISSSFAELRQPSPSGLPG